MEKAIAEEGKESRESVDKDKGEKDKDRPTFLSKVSLASNIDEIKEVEKNDIIQEENLVEKERELSEEVSEDVLERSNTLYIKTFKSITKSRLFFCSNNNNMLFIHWSYF